MLRPQKKRESLAGKLLLSSALVALSLAYAKWQRNPTPGPNLAVAPMVKPPVLDRPAPILPNVTMAPAAQPGPPRVDVAHDEKAIAKRDSVAPPSQKPLAVAKAELQTTPVMPAAPESPPQQNPGAPPETPSPLTAQQALQMNLPTDGASPPLPLITGAPAAGAASPAPAGLHLADGDYVSDRQQLAWGDLRAKISIHGGLITAVQILQYPDHRSQSLYLSQMAGPILASEVIKSQKAQVDAVSSATDTSYAFQDTIANAIEKATRE
jgi:uncharacterized protein with FMN-binding domain